jgi:hypothetical protein
LSCTTSDLIADAHKLSAEIARDAVVLGRIDDQLADQLAVAAWMMRTSRSCTSIKTGSGVDSSDADVV